MRLVCRWVLWSILGATCSAAQVAPDASAGAALRNLASRAGAVFVGQVVAVERAGGVVVVTFRVDQPVSGVSGSTYTLREWAGTWPPGQHRYVAGQRALFFLHAAGRSGLSSAVDGMEGVVPVVATAADEPLLADVRRLDARVLRPVGAALPDAASAGAILLSDATRVASGWRSPRWSEPQRRSLPGAAAAGRLPGIHPILAEVPLAGR